MEIIILVGGLGTRLRAVSKDLPKPMVDICGKPFLYRLMSYVSRFNVSKIILATGYKSELIRNYFKNTFNGIRVEYSIEESPLGTGGAIKKAINLCEDPNCIVLNGDTYFNIDLNDFFNNSLESNFKASIALKEMKDFDRYGAVEVKDGIIKAFHEKKRMEKGLINAGIYCFDTSLFNDLDFKENIAFSIEKEYLEKNTGALHALVYTNYFIDIGIESDYYKFVSDFDTINTTINESP